MATPVGESHLLQALKALRSASDEFDGLAKTGDEMTLTVNRVAGLVKAAMEGTPGAKEALEDLELARNNLQGALKYLLQADQRVRTKLGALNN